MSPLNLCVNIWWTHFYLTIHMDRLVRFMLVYLYKEMVYTNVYIQQTYDNMEYI